MNLLNANGYYAKGLCLAFILILGLGACTKKSQKQSEENSQTSATYEVHEFMEEAPELLDQEVNVLGLCTGVCKRSGTKLFMVGDSEEEVLRVECAGELKRFSEDCIGKIVQIHGVVAEDRLNEEDILQWEQRLLEEKKSKDTKGEKKEGDCCDEDKKSMGIDPHQRAMETIAKYREQIAERKQKEGKDYLSFYYVKVDRYEIEPED